MIIIGIGAYCIACSSKRAQVFIIFRKNLWCKVKKEASRKTDPELLYQ